MQNNKLKTPSLFEAFLPILFLIGFLAVNVTLVFGDDSLSGANQMALIFSAAVACIVASRLGMTWKQMLDGIVNSITSAMPSILILLLIGSLAGTWLLSGIVPAMIYYGLDLLSPSIFLVASCIICAIVSIATGSSWTTIATIGVALLGIGKTLGMEEGLVAGAIISGAYFGDKMSPLSDTTNLAPAMAGTDLFTHIRYMAYTTVPSIVIALLIFLAIGFSYSGDTDQKLVAEVQGAIKNTFHISPWLFLVPVVVVGLIVKKVEALPALFIGTLLGGVSAMIFQQDLLASLATSDGTLISYAKDHLIAEGITGAALEQQIPGIIQNSPFITNFTLLMKALYTDLSITTGNASIDSEGLLSSGGMVGMLNTIWLIICAMIFGGVMESSGLLARITADIVKTFAKGTGSLIASTSVTCMFFNFTASDQYLAIVVPGRMYAPAFKDRGLAPENLSRTLEDSGTVTSVLIPWNTCGAYQSGVLGVATIAYLPYCFFNILSPIMTILFGFLQLKIRMISEQKSENEGVIAE